MTSASRTASDTTLQHQALSYIDSNCGYCHRPGIIFTSQFDARLSIPLANSAIINGFAFNNLGIIGSAIVVPGDTSKSLIYQRMRSLETQVAMPPIAKGRVDSLGLRLISDWILSLGEQTNTENKSQWPTTSLRSSYPNPFLYDATISFSLAQNERVHMVLYDVNGIELRTLLDQPMQRGLHEITLNGAGLASGTYYIYMKTGLLSYSKPITLLK